MEDEANLFEGDPKAPFSIATTPRYRGEHYSFPGLLHFTLDAHFIMLSVKQGGIKYHFWVFCMIRPRTEPRSPGPLANTLVIRPIALLRMKQSVNWLKDVTDIGLAVRVFANGPGDLGSIPGRVIPKTQKMVLDASLLNTQHYKVRVKGKVEQSREGVAPFPTHWCSIYRKGSLRITLDNGRPLFT